MSRPAERPSRAEKQEQTRRELTASAARVFARDGYHGASLEVIAAEAGYSKGAVYSNFASKADLFLAVLDRRIESGATRRWDPFTADASDVQEHLDQQLDDEPDLAGSMLAGIEFFASASREPELLEALQQRRDRLLDLYLELAEESRSEADHLSAEQLARLLFALDQGLGLLLVYDLDDALDARAVTAAFQRLLDPARAAAIPHDRR